MNRELEAIQLAGGPTTPEIVALMDRTIGDFPIDHETSVASAWSAMLKASEPSFTGRMRRIGSAGSRSNARDSVQDWNDECEPRSHRGTAGVLRDVLEDRLDHDGLVVVVEASASPAVRLSSLVERARSDPDGSIVFLGISELDRYAGVMVVPFRILQSVPSVGFFDLKEQLLPLCRARGYGLEGEVIARRAIRIHDRESWLAAIHEWRLLHELDSEPEWCAGSRIEGASVVSNTSQVDGATIVSSIVMPGARLEPGAVVARSIIADGAVVSRDRVVTDRIVSVGEVVR